MRRVVKKRKQRAANMRVRQKIVRIKKCHKIEPVKERRIEEEAAERHERAVGERKGKTGISAHEGTTAQGKAFADRGWYKSGLTEANKDMDVRGWQGMGRESYKQRLLRTARRQRRVLKVWRYKIVGNGRQKIGWVNEQRQRVTKGNQQKGVKRVGEGDKEKDGMVERRQLKAVTERSRDGQGRGRDSYGW